MVEFEYLDKVFQGKLTLIVQLARELAEVKGYEFGYHFGKEWLAKFVGYESCYRAHGDPERTKIKAIVKTADAYDVALRELVVACQIGEAWRLKPSGQWIRAVSEFMQGGRAQREQERNALYARVIDS